MRALLRAVFVLSLLLALLTLVVIDDESLGIAGRFSDIPVIALAGILGFVAALLMRRRPAPAAQVVPTTPPDVFDQRVVLLFSRQLLAARSGAELRATIESRMPVLLDGRKVWIAWGPPPSAQGTGKEQHEPLLTDDVQEWTTFALRLDDKRIGLLGIESAGGLTTNLKDSIQSVTPLIAQAVQSVLEMDAFREASVLDPLTNATTRREGLNRLQAEVKRAQRIGSTMAVLMIDLDHFKSINDRYGHAVGDMLLTEIGQTLSRTLRATDIRCRWGGEEFLVVLPDTTLAQAQVAATHLLQSVAATSVSTAQGPVSSTASIGLTISRPAETDVNMIVKRADIALYNAKHAGRSCIRVVLGDLEGEPVAGKSARKAPGPRAHETLPFPDRRNPNLSDRRRVPSPGRRKTDPVAPCVRPVVEDEARAANG